MARNSRQPPIAQYRVANIGLLEKKVILKRIQWNFKLKFEIGL